MSKIRQVCTHSATLLLAVALIHTSVQAATIGSIFLTGHDPDFHALAGNSSGAAAITDNAIKFVTDPAYNPFSGRGINKFLYVTSSIVPPGGHIDGTNGIVASGFVLGTDFDRADASTLVTALGQLGTKYDALVIASDFGGILTQAELNVLDAHSSEIINFLNHGGGLYAMAESDSGAKLTPDGGLFGYLPFIVSSAQKNQSEIGNTVTAFGSSLGLSNSDVNGNASHNVFLGTAGLNIVDLDSTGAILSLAGRGNVNGGGVSQTPEPSGALLLVLGLGAFGFLRKIRNRSV